MPVPQISVEGRIVGDISFKFTDEGLPVARFRMVAADRRQQPNGEWVDTETFWITVTAFRKLAENIADSLRDRDAVVVMGKLSTAEWVDEGGQTRSAPKLIASSVGPSLFFLPRPHGQGQSQGSYAPQRAAQPRQQPAGQGNEGPDPAPGDDPWTTPLTRTPAHQGDPWA
jgi:single-strand DNA-binding protein